MEAAKRKAFSLYDDEDEEETTSVPPKKSNDSKEEEKVEVANKDEELCNNSEKNCDDEAEQHSCMTACRGIEMYASAARQGERPEMEDAQIEHIKFDLEKPFLKRCALFAIFDGHAGSKASKYCEKVFAETLKKHLSSFNDLATLEKSLKRVFTDVYKSIDDAFLNDARNEKPMWKDGTTVTNVLFLNNSIYVANIGDSRALVCRQKKGEKAITIQLTVDHNPSVYDERVRIQKAGGFVKDGRINGSIEVSRSIGDINFKRLGVISVPDVKKLTITDDDK
ncbi:unnamed protein product [Auanema sp. JU1783]|nr:unnamed protein product [Auanema sp. JU1783]